MVFSLVPRNTNTLRILPLAILLTVIVFIAFMAFIAFAIAGKEWFKSGAVRNG